jgi:NAD(P)-dependent dehydrogenase (short-subunit alcohol dehydrogenase family)
VALNTLLFADRYANEGINVYENRLGIIKTPLTEIVKDKYDKLISDGITPIKRWVQPEEISKTISAITEKSFPFFTGQDLDVAGGSHIHHL